jgi:hypothetical protein
MRFPDFPDVTIPRALERHLVNKMKSIFLSENKFLVCNGQDFVQASPALPDLSRKTVSANDCFCRLIIISVLLSVDPPTNYKTQKGCRKNGSLNL